MIDETVLAAQRGEEWAWEEIYATYMPRVRGLCHKILRRPNMVEDAVQDVFVLVMRRIETFRGEAKFGTWLYNVTTNLCLCRLRSGRRMAQYKMYSLDGAAWEHEDHDDETLRHLQYLATRDTHLESAPLRCDLERAVRCLPPGQRHIFTLRDIQQKSVGETARLAGTTYGNVKSQTAKARGKVREMLRGERKT